MVDEKMESDGEKGGARTRLPSWREGGRGGRGSVVKLVASYNVTYSLNDVFIVLPFYFMALASPLALLHHLLALLHWY